MVPYLPHTDEDLAGMLASLGAASLDELFADIPAELRLDRPLALPEGLSEAEVLRRLAALGRRNATDRVCFLGAGIYDHLVPATVPDLVSRSEFYTAYTPYQAEIAQGMLQAIFEFQTLICELTGLEVSNASLYDGATAAAEGAVMALNSVRGARTVLVSAALHPDTRQVLATRFAGTDVRLVEVAAGEGVTSAPTWSGGWRRPPPPEGRRASRPSWCSPPTSSAAWRTGAGWPTCCTPAARCSWCPPIPSRWGCCAPRAPGGRHGRGRRPAAGPGAVVRRAHGGLPRRPPELLHRMPGRIVGQSVDRDGRRAFLLTLQAREQHIKRQRATSNICSNQALAALAATIYLATLGRRGLAEAGRQSAWKAHYLHDRLTASWA